MSALHALDLAGAPRVLVITKFRYLGDSIVATPFLRELKAAIPGARTTLLAGPAIPALMEGCPFLEDVWGVDPRAEPVIAGTVRLASRIRSQRFDAVFLLNRSLHSALVAAIARIPVRVGHDTEGRKLLLTHRAAYDWSKPDRLCAFDLLTSAGISVPADHLSLPELWVSEEERQRARDWLTGIGIDFGGPLVAIQAGANDPEVRAWRPERFAEVADSLVRERGARILLTGSHSERPVVERVAAAMQERSNIVAGETTLRQAIAILPLCDLWIGNDGGMLHAAVGLGPATIGIFGPAKAPRWSYDTDRHRTLVKYPEPRAADARTIRRCLDAIPASEAVCVAFELLDARRTKRKETSICES